ncbi:MAG: FCD domain-containing protein [Geminicoccales bacterium]
MAGARIRAAEDGAAFALRARPIERRRVFEEIVERIEAMLLAGDLRPGDRLPPERELMRLFQVGRTSVREALFALQRKGVVALQAGERAAVTSPSAAGMVADLSGAARFYMASEPGMRDFQRVRALFEAALARHAARVASADDLALLETALRDNQRARGDEARFVETDVAFHYAIARIVESPLIDALHTALVAWLREQRTASIAPRGSARAAARAHRAIFEAIAAHDQDAAEQAMQDHLAEVERFYWQARRSDGAQAGG